MLSQGRKITAITGIFLLAVVSMFSFIFIPAIASLFENFPENVGTVNYFIAGSNGCTLVLMLLVPLLQNLFGQKKLLLIGAAAIAIGGGIGLISTGINGYCVAITVVLCGYGITGTMALSVLMEIIAEKHISLFNGLYQAIVAISGAVLAVVGGILTVRSWQYAISATWIFCAVLGILAFVLLLFSVPSEIGSEIEEEAASEDKNIPWKNIIFVFAIFFLLGTVYTYINSLFSVYVEENLLGDASFAGSLQSIGTIGSCIMCFAFAFAYAKIGKKIILIPILIIAVGTFLLALIGSPAICVVCSLLMGAAFGCATTYFYTICPDIAPLHMTVAVAAVGIALNLPYVIYSYLYTFMVQSMGTMTRSLLVLGVVQVADLVLALIYLKNMKEEKACQ